jgi:hypothetical protein
MVTSDGGAQELTMIAAIDPWAEPVGEKAAPIESTGGPAGQAGYEERMTSR